MMSADNAVQASIAGWNGLQAVGEDSWRLLLEMFLNSQDISSKSRQTYSWALVRYFDWLRRTGRMLNGLTPADIVGYKSYLLGRNLSPLTVSAYMSALRQFYGWTEVSLFYPNIARSVKAPRTKKGFMKSPLSPKQATALLDYLKGKSLRNYAIVNLILRTGLRTIEVSRLDVKDIVFRHGKRVLLVWGKGMASKDSLVILNDPAWEPIRDYLQTRKAAKPGGPLFITDRKGHRGFLDIPHQSPRRSIRQPSRRRYDSRRIRKLCLTRCSDDGSRTDGYALKSLPIYIVKYDSLGFAEQDSVLSYPDS